MYPDQIKNYTTEKQFENHKKMLAEMKKYYKSDPNVSLPTLENMRKEELLLARLHKKWKKHQAK